MPKTDLEIRGEGGGGSVWSKNKGVAWAPPLDPPMQMHHAGLQ